jgi:hypothetical protein
VRFLPENVKSLGIQELLWEINHYPHPKKTFNPIATTPASLVLFPFIVCCKLAT